MSEQKEVLKTCKTCGHRNGDMCMLSGFYTATERQYPSVCGVDFHGWKPRGDEFDIGWKTGFTAGIVLVLCAVIVFFAIYLNVK